MVPRLTSGNAVLCMQFEVQANLQVKQRGIGRPALGTHEKAPNAAGQGDRGQFAFKSRQGSSKIEYDQRLTEMKDTRRARKVYQFMFTKSLNTKWTLRGQKLRSRYLTVKGENSGIARTDTAAKEPQNQTWKDRMDMQVIFGGIQSVENRNIKRTLL